MIKTLRRKFIFFAMSAVTLMLLILLFAINGFTWLQFEWQGNKILETLTSSEVAFTKMPPPQNGAKGAVSPEFERMRTARFFIVHMSTASEEISCDLNQVFFVDEDTAIEYGKTAFNRNNTSGRIDRYKYRIKIVEEIRDIYFLDMSRERSTIKTVMFTSGAIAAGSWLISLIFVLISSVWYVQPIIAGLEKQKQFITNAGHELKTPLAIIQSNNDAMSLIHGENKYNRNIRTQVARLGELTGNLLMQARLDEEVELVNELINISSLTNEILQPFQDSAENRGIAFTSSIAENIMLNTNRQAFTQLVTVLMDNAMKYTTDRGEIRFTLENDDKHVLITEENSCDPEMDIDPEGLFERFYRADTARTQNDQQSGYGIGLSVARSICKSLGGTLTASFPQPGKIRFIAKL